jgi:hypothetical protein
VSASVSALEALRSRRYAKPQPGMAARRARCCSDGMPVLTVTLCVAAMLLLIVPLLTIEANARGGGAGGGGHGGGFGGRGGGFGGHGGFVGGVGGGLGFTSRGGALGLGGARSFGVARFGGAGIGGRPFGVADEQKARFNAIAPADDPETLAQDERDLANLCDEKTPGVTDLPIDRIAQAVQPTLEQRAALHDLRDASVKAAEALKVNCPTCQRLTRQVGSKRWRSGLVPRSVRCGPCNPRSRNSTVR